MTANDGHATSFGSVADSYDRARPGPARRLGVLWTSRDRDEDWVAELDLVRLGSTGSGERPPAPVTVRLR